jgi:hypothetical protein
MARPRTMFVPPGVVRAVVSFPPSPDGCWKGAPGGQKGMQPTMAGGIGLMTLDYGVR